MVGWRLTIPIVRYKARLGYRKLTLSFVRDRPFVTFLALRPRDMYRC